MPISNYIMSRLSILSISEEDSHNKTKMNRCLSVEVPFNSSPIKTQKFKLRRLIETNNKTGKIEKNLITALNRKTHKETIEARKTQNQIQKKIISVTKQVNLLKKQLDLKRKNESEEARSKIFLKKWKFEKNQDKQRKLRFRNKTENNIKKNLYEAQEHRNQTAKQLAISKFLISNNNKNSAMNKKQQSIKQLDFFTKEIKLQAEEKKLKALQIRMEIEKGNKIKTDYQKKRLEMTQKLLKLEVEAKREANEKFLRKAERLARLELNLEDQLSGAKRHNEYSCVGRKFKSKFGSLTKSGKKSNFKISKSARRNKLEQSIGSRLRDNTKLGGSQIGARKSRKMIKVNKSGKQKLILGRVWISNRNKGTTSPQRIHLNNFF